MNPVEERLAQLQGQWTSFAEQTEARLLIWRASEEEEPLLDAFLAREREAEASGTPDLFVQLARPFLAAAGHGVALVSDLLDQYDQIAPLIDGEQEVRWRCPPPSASSDVAYFVSVLDSLRRHLVEDDENAPACESRVIVDSRIAVMWTLGSAPCGHRDRRRGQRDRRHVDTRIAVTRTVGSPVRTAGSPTRGQRDRSRGRLDRRADT